MSARSNPAMAAFNPPEVNAYYAARVPSLRQTPTWQWRGVCPVRHGKRDSFSVDRETGRWYCHSACARGGGIIELEMALSGGAFAEAKKAVFAFVGRIPIVQSARQKPAIPRLKADPGPWREVEVYPYLDEVGVFLYEIARSERGDGSEREKKFTVRRPDGRGGWIYNLDGTRRVLFRLPKVRAADSVYLVEGEKCVAALEDWGLVATCSPFGADRWDEGYAEHFKGKNCYLLPDHDKPGRRHMASAAASLIPGAASIRIIELPGLEAKGDVVDWISAGGSLVLLRELVESRLALDAATLSTLRERWGWQTRKLTTERA